MEKKKKKKKRYHFSVTHVQSKQLSTLITGEEYSSLLIFSHHSLPRERDRSTIDRGLKRVDHEGRARANKLSAVLTDDGDSLDITFGSGGGPPTKSFDPHYHRAKLRSRGWSVSRATTTFPRSNVTLSDQQYFIFFRSDGIGF